jgi:hypothetical protein
VALTTTEAEYVDLVGARRNAVWFGNMLLEIGVISENCVVKLFEDNTACIVQEKLCVGVSALEALSCFDGTS